MSTLFDDAVHTALAARVGALRADSPRQWGRMSPHQAVCHLSDGFRLVLGEKSVPARTTLLSPVMRWVALDLPLRWPHGVSTMPEADQEIGGTRPVEFERDRCDLLALMERFRVTDRGGAWPDHPMFGAMTADRWARWACRHLDHHLRQFGA